MRMRILTSIIGVVAALVTSGTQAHDSRWLGDGRISSGPKTDHLFSCKQDFNPNASGAHRTGPWLKGDRYHPHEKIHVNGEVNWPNARINIIAEKGMRIVQANNIPTHSTGEYPIRQSDPAYQYDRNPNSIREQIILMRLPLMPRFAQSPSCVPMGLVAFTLVGGALYNAVDAGGRDAAAYEILDACGGHPQRSGQYHYHDYAPCLPKGLDQNGHSSLIAYALDGFGVYGSKDVGGRAVTNKNLDACHGHEGPVMWNDTAQSIYHYHMNNEYPYTIGCLSGTPSQNVGTNAPSSAGHPFNQPQFGSQRTAPPRRGGGPLAKIARELNISLNDLRRAVGPPPPDIDRAARLLKINPERLRKLFKQNHPR
jgi:hypothetical protein